MIKYKPAVFFALTSSLMFFFILTGSIYLVGIKYEISSYRDITNILNIILQIVISHSRVIGLSSIFFPIGLVLLSTENKIRQRAIFLLLIFILFTPFVHDIQYAGLFIFPFICLCIVNGILNIIKHLDNINKFSTPFFQF